MPTLLDAINYLKESWSNVTSVTISNCFRAAGFSKAPEEIVEEEEAQEIGFEEQLLLEDNKQTPSLYKIEEIVHLFNNVVIDDENDDDD